MAKVTIRDKLLEVLADGMPRTSTQLARDAGVGLGNAVRATRKMAAAGELVKAGENRANRTGRLTSVWTLADDDAPPWDT